MHPKDLIKFAYIARRVRGRLYFYQRVISWSKIASIVKYIDSEGRIFPNSIIIAFNKKPTFRDIPESHMKQDFFWSNPYDITLGVLEFPSRFGVSWVIDGQHRLLGLVNLVYRGKKSSLCVKHLRVSKIIE